MTCTQCGTEIADKAIVCYRCGAATAAPAPATMPSMKAAVWIAVGSTVLLPVLLVLFAIGDVQGSPAVKTSVDVLAGAVTVFNLWRLRVLRRRLAASKHRQSR
jgi:uncharacterized membrane protein YvbJ